MGIIKGHFDKMCADAIKRFTKKNKIQLPDELQVLLYLIQTEPDNPEIQFLLLKNYQGLEKLTAKQIVDTKLDLRNRAAFLEHHAAVMLIEIMTENELQWQDIRVILELKGELIRAHLYRGDEYIKELDLNEILSDEKMMQENG